VRRLMKIATAVLACLTLGTTTAAAAAPGATARPVTFAHLRHQFDYQRGPIHVTDHGVTSGHGFRVHDITYRAAGQDPVSAYLVLPREGSHVQRHPAALFLHWLDTPEESTRGEFLDEAESLAAGPDHVVSLLPQLTFPFAYGPVGDVRDRDSIIKQVVQLRRGLDLLDARDDVSTHRVAVVGHDYGAMYASLLSAVDRSRVRSEVIMAADATMSHWFVKYFLALPDDQVAPYKRMLRAVDPIHYIGHGADRLLLQYATNDFYIPMSVAQRMHTRAGAGAHFRTYDIDHSLRTPAAQTDRDAFLHKTIGG
jgi:pimeloyl-ACP methyl ester carboxylesterase